MIRRFEHYLKQTMQLDVRSFATLAVWLGCVIALAPAVSAQEATAPPPVSVLPKEARVRLDERSDLKDRTKLSLELMNDRLGSAEKLLTSEDYDGMFRELGYFNALIDDCLGYLQKRGDGGKVLDNLKRFEIGIRPFIPRLETIRREVPTKYEDYVGTLMKVIRDARSKATEPMFSDKVVPNAKPSDQ